jgi:hypothetical protein
MNATATKSGVLATVGLRVVEISTGLGGVVDYKTDDFEGCTYIYVEFDNGSNGTYYNSDLKLLQSEKTSRPLKMWNF